MVRPADAWGQTDWAGVTTIQGRTSARVSSVTRDVAEGDCIMVALLVVLSSVGEFFGCPGL